MIKPERDIVAYRSRNPIAIYAHELLYACRTLGPPFSESILDCSNSCPLKFNDFISFIIFEVIAREYKATGKTRSLRQHIKDKLAREGRDTDESTILSEEKFYSSKMPVFLKAREAELARLKIPDNSAFKLASNRMNGRENLKEGYELTRIQFLQLVDECALNIKKVHELRRIANSHHSDASSQAKKFYSDIGRVCVERSETNDIGDRIAYAINFDDFENKNLVDICFRVAEYCSNNGIRTITDDMIASLISITGILPCGARVKPVLLIKNLIPAALHESVDSDAKFQIDRYKELQRIGLWLRNNSVSIEPLFTIYKFSLEDFWEFIYYDYNTFDLYQDVQWEGKKRIFPSWCRIVKSLTLDPYSTEF